MYKRQQTDRQTDRQTDTQIIIVNTITTIANKDKTNLMTMHFVPKGLDPASRRNSFRCKETTLQLPALASRGTLRSFYLRLQHLMLLDFEVTSSEYRTLMLLLNVRC